MNRPLTRIIQGIFALSLSTSAWAQAGSDRIPATIKLVVPFGPGGSNDIIARTIAPALSKKLGTTIIVENKPGAAGSIGADSVAKSPKDGSTLLLTSSTIVTSAATMPRTTPYNVISAFAPVSIIGLGPMLVAVPTSLPIKKPAELIAAAKANPGSISYGTSGPGSIAHMSSEMLGDASNIQMLHVPYKGAAQAQLDLASGRIQMMISNYTSLLSQIKADRIRPLAITSATPNAAFPDLPPMSTVAPGFSAEIWVAVFAPAGTPTALIDRLNKEINEVSQLPEVKALLAADGAQPVSLPPAGVAKLIREDFEAWKKIADAKNIRAE